MFGRIICDSIPNCVPEHYRSLQADEDHQAELRMERQERYRANREKIRAAIEAGLPVLDYGGYRQCWDCGDADSDTMRDDEDDFECVICHNPACPLHKRHQPEEGTE